MKSLLLPVVPEVTAAVIARPVAVLPVAVLPGWKRPW
jgi:hypothetical protein